MITLYPHSEVRANRADENQLRLGLKIELLASEALVHEVAVP